MKMRRPGRERQRSVGAVARALAGIVLVGIALTIGGGCSHLPRPHWPWHRTPAASPEAVHELLETRPDGSSGEFPQYWKRNTLVLDMRSAGSQGSVMLQPREHTLWPVRIAFRVLPGEFGELDIRAQQRVVLPITASGTKPVDLELAPGVYLMKTPRITVAWGPNQSPGS